jgi:hypothetical protein
VIPDYVPTSSQENLDRAVALEEEIEITPSTKSTKAHITAKLSEENPAAATENFLAYRVSTRYSKSIKVLATLWVLIASSTAADFNLFCMR